MGSFELRHGSPQEASRLLRLALELYEAAIDASSDPRELVQEALRTRWHLAEAAAAQGRLHEAISAYHILRTALLEGGAIVQAATAVVEIVDLHLQSGRETQLPSLLATFVEVLRDAGAPVNVIEPLAYLRGRANADALTAGEVILARTFFEELGPNPNGRFRPF